MSSNSAPSPISWRRALYQTVFESNTRMGRIFDLLLIGVILTSVATVMLNSVHSLRDRNRLMITELIRCRCIGSG